MSKNESYSKIRSNKNLKRIFLLLFFAVSLIMIFIYRYYFWPFIFALVFYVTLKPIYEFLIKYLKYKQLTTVATLLIYLVLIALPFFWLAVSLADQSYQFYIFIKNQVNLNQLEIFLKENKFVQDILTSFNVSEREIWQKIVENLEKTSHAIFEKLTEVVTFSIKFVVNFFFMLLIMYFFFSEGYSLSSKIYGIIPFPDDIEKDIFDRLKQVIKIIVAGNLLIMTLQGLMVGLGFYIFQFSAPLLAGSVAAAFSLIPVVGTSIVFIPATLYMVIAGNYLMAGLFFTWCFAWYFLLENLVKPKVLGKKLNFHPLVFFFLLLGSIQTFNLPGVIFGPVLLTLFYSLWEIYKILDVYGIESKAKLSKE